ncbi:hypothetical protein EBZ80_05065 [bacterium]|nr:hypothetical protein [bacterium]
MTYKRYLFTRDDRYAAVLRCRAGDLTARALRHARRLLTLSVSGITLNDSYNPVVVREGREARQSRCSPATLFSPYCMTYDPDVFQDGPIGWPIRDRRVQRRGYEAVASGRPSCIAFEQDGFFRQSPYTSHCSAFAAWAVQEVFGISLAPIQIGDWCHAAAEQRDLMAAMPDWWMRTDAVGAQEAANAGRLVVAVKKVDDPDREGYRQNGHIAVVLPCSAAMAADLQRHQNYPKEPVVTDEPSFAAFVRLCGPECIQAGGLNFGHTVAANAFSNYYGDDDQPGETPIDEVVEFFIYRLYTQE